MNLNESIASVEKDLNVAKDQLAKAVEAKQGMEEVLKMFKWLWMMRKGMLKNNNSM